MHPKTGFFKQVHLLAANIPQGKVMTYGQIAEALGGRYSARFVGFAMSACPEGIPAHRVVNRKGEMAGGLIFGGESAQRNLLISEGVPFLNNGCVNLAQALHRPGKSG